MQREEEGSLSGGNIKGKHAWDQEGGRNAVEEIGRKPANWVQGTYKKELER